MQQRLGPGKCFLWVDENPEELARVRAGEIVVSPVGKHDPKRVPDGLIHDWRGAVFIDHASLADVMRVIRDYPRYKDIYRPSVVDSRLLPSSEADDRFSLLLMNKALLLKTAFDADYQYSYNRAGAHRIYSISRTTRVQEIEDYGSPAQRLLNQGEGSGIIWGLFAITRYMERDGGVYIEVEAIGLSRDIPDSLRWLVDPMVRRFSRRAVATSLDDIEKAVCDRAGVAFRAVASTRGSH